MISGRELKNTEDLKSLWVLTCVFKGEKHLISDDKKAVVIARWADEVESVGEKIGHPYRAVQNTTPLFESLQEATKALDELKKVYAKYNLVFSAEPASDILTVRWTMDLNEIKMTAVFSPMFFPKEAEKEVVSSSKDDARRRALASVTNHIAILNGLKTDIEKAQ